MRATVNLLLLVYLQCLGWPLVAQVVAGGVDGPIQAAMRNPDGVAAVIGVAHYRHPDVAPVEFALNDATVIKRLLIDTLGYSEARVLTRLDESASLSGMKLLIRGDLASRIVPDKSDIVVYYSGHGAPNADTRESYLIPWEYDPSYAPSSDSAYPLKGLYADLAGLKARSVIVLLDTCFSGQSDSASGRSAPVVKDISPPFIEVPLPGLPNGVVIAAAGSREVATWDRKHRHGLFTYYLLRGLQGDAADSRGVVRAAALQRYLAEKVPQAARELRQRNQNPVMITSNDETVVARLSPPKYGSLAVTVDVGGELWIDGVQAGIATPGEELALVHIKAGAHELEVRKEQYESLQEQVVVPPGQALRKSYQLVKMLPDQPHSEPAFGLIQVTAKDGGTLFIDGKKVAELKPFEKYTTARTEAGFHKVRIEKPGWQPAEKQVEVKPRQTAIAELRLLRAPSGKRPVPQRKPTPTAGRRPNTGELVWQGEVGSNGRVVIDGARSTSGKLIKGAIPGVPVRLIVLDKDVTLLESPNSSNGYRRLVLGCSRKGVITLRLRWQRIEGQ